MTRRRRDAMRGRNCPQCRKPMTSHNRRPTRDHIKPREFGGLSIPENIRIVCSDCNGLRALAGHCVGALACALAVANEMRIAPLHVILRWRLHHWK